MNETWMASLRLAHAYWLYPFGLLATVVFFLLAFAVLRRRPLPTRFPFLNRIFLISADLQWLLGVMYWVATQQWSVRDESMIQFRHPVIMTAVWLMYRYGNNKMKNSLNAETAARDGFWYYSLAVVFLVIGVFQVMGS